MMLANPLCLGSSGDPVKELQRTLNGLRVMPQLNPDGRFGRNTDRNVRTFQRQKGLKTDGVVGARTAKALGWSYSGQAARPYVVRMQQPPLPATTPPLHVMADAILVAMDRYHTAIVAEVRNSGAAPEWIAKAVRALSVPHEYLAARLAKLKTDTSTPDFLEAYFAQDVLQYQLMTVQVAVWLQEHGGDTRRLKRLFDGLKSPHMASIVRRFLDGELSAAIAIATIDIHVTAALGVLLPVPPAPH